jgi:hypothetical protein
MFKRLILLILAVWSIHESIRYYDGHKLVVSQRQQWEGALHKDSPCSQPKVRSIEYRGQVIECNALRLLMEQPTLTIAFSLWWKTSWWMHLYQSLIQNTLILTILAIVTIVCMFMFGTQYLTTIKWQKELINLIPMATSSHRRGEEEEDELRLAASTSSRKQQQLLYLDSITAVPSSSLQLPSRKIVQNLRN